MPADTHHSELLPWHQALFERLCRLDAEDRLPHALLFQGPGGIGKRSLAQYFAHWLLCRSPRDGQPCGHCSACHQVLAGTHPDLKTVMPQESHNNIRVEQVRELVEFLSRTAGEGSRKVVLLAPAESMNINAANALLKGLEEPAAGTLLMLISHHPALLLPTVRSRCRVQKFERPDAGQALAWLASKNVSAQAQVLLKLADGAPLRALALADEDRQHERSVLHDSLRRLLLREISSLEAASLCAGFHINANVEGMMLCVGDLLRHVQSQGGLALRDPDLEAVARGLRERRGRAHGTALARALHGLRSQLLEARHAIVSNTNPNPQLMLESLFHSWSNL